MCSKLCIVLTSVAVAFEIPEIRKLREAVTLAEEVIVIVKIVGGYFFSSSNILDSPTRKLEIVSGKAYCVC